MNWELMFPGKYLKSAEFEGKDATYTVKSVVLDDLPEEKGGTKRRGIVGFHETSKLLVLNRTNATCIVRMFGTETNGWIGKKVTFFPAPFTDPFTGEVGTAIRVRGSPELQATMEFQAKVGRKQAMFKLVRTGATQPAQAIDVAAWSDEKLSGRLDTLQKWLAAAKPNNPAILKTKLEMSVIENELERRMGEGSSPPPPGDGLAGEAAP